LTNAKGVPATIDEIDVLDAANPARVLQSLSGAALDAALYTLAARPAPDHTLAPGASKVVFLALDFAAASQVPAAIVHRFVGTGADSPASRAPSAISYLAATIPLPGFQPPRLGAPLRGDGWVAVNGCCLARRAHLNALQSVNGDLYNAQRFAID